MDKKSNDQVLDQLQSSNLGNVHNEYMNMLKNVFLGSIAGGAAVRGGQGLYNMWQRNVEPEKPVEAPLAFSIPTKKEPATAGEMEYGKMATWPVDGVWDSTVKPVADAITGASAQTPSELPYHLLGLGGAGALGLYGGYKGVDSLMQSGRKSELEAEEQNAKHHYEQALARLSGKTANDKFERLYSKKGTLGQIINGAVAPMGIIAGLTGVATYNLANSRRHSKLLDKAVQERQRQQLADAPVFAYPAESDNTEPSSTSSIPL
jgi:hypothetical protein